MMTGIQYLLSVLLAVSAFVGCAGEELDTHSFTGLTKTEVRKRLGEPDDMRMLVKNTEHIWGPIEGMWYQLDMGDKIETWIYKTSSGRKEIYFLGTSDKVAGEFFWYKDHRKNPVFESQGPTNTSTAP